MRAVRCTLRDLGTRLGVLEYRPALRWSKEKWASTYAERLADDFGDITEAARFGLVLGYLAYLGGEPSILDVGCGDGLLRARVGSFPFTRYVGIDPIAEAIERAQQTAYPRTEFVAADPMEADLGTFDIVICSEVLYAVPDPAAFLDRMNTFLAPGGHIITSIWRHPGDVKLWELLDARFELLDRSSVRNPANRIAIRGWVGACHRKKQ